MANQLDIGAAQGTGTGNAVAIPDIASQTQAAVAPRRTMLMQGPPRVDYSGLAAGLKELGDTGQQILASYQKRGQQASAANDQAWMAQTLSDTQARATKYLQDQEQTAGPGAPKFTDNFDSWFQQQSEAAVANANNPAIKQELTTRLNAIHSDLSIRANGFQLGEAQRNQASMWDDSIDNISRTVYSDPSSYAGQVNQQKAIITSPTLPDGRQNPLDADTQTKLISRLEDTASVSAAQGLIAKNPRGAVSILSPDTPDHPLAAPFLDKLDPQKRMALYNEAKTQVQRQEDKARADAMVKIEAQEPDDIAAYQRGQTPPGRPLTQADFNAAYGPNGERKYQAYAAAQQYSQNYKRLATMAPQQMADFLKSTTPQPGEGYAAKAQYQDSLTGTAQDILRQRNSDPSTFANDNGLATLKPINFSNPAEAAAELKNRSATARMMNQRYGAPLMPLGVNEAKVMAANLDAMPSSAKLSTLKTIHDNTDPQSYNAIMQQIRPDSPVTSMAGALLDKQNPLTTGTHWIGPNDTIGVPDVASRILQGEALLNPTKGDKATDGKPKFAMPSETDLRTAWNGYIGNAYRGAPQTEETSYQAFRAFYAATMAKQGKYDGVLDSNAAGLAAKSVSGGVTNYNGSNVVLPWGMDESTFRNQVAAQIKARNLPDAAGLRTIGDGQYAATLGTGPLRDKNGKPVVINLTQDALGPTSVGPDEIFQANQQYVKPGADYNTKLSPSMESDFQAWAHKHDVRTNDPGYDMRGFYKAQQSGDERAKQGYNATAGAMHFPDVWKTPYSDSFSNESMYATADAPRWEGRYLVDKHGTKLFDDKAYRRLVVQ